MKNPTNSEFKEVYSEHMQTMLECMAVCFACSKKCIDEGHKETAALCADCADVCSLAIKAMSKQAEYEEKVMELCSLTCQKCAEACKKMEAKHCQECASVCKHCAEVCSTTSINQ